VVCHGLGWAGFDQPKMVVSAIGKIAPTRSRNNFIFLAFVLAFAGCRPAAETNTPANDTSRVDAAAQNDKPSADFVQRVKLYYESVQKRDWALSYDMRTDAFKQDVTRDVYLKEMYDSGENLTWYKVLNVHLFGGAPGDLTAAEIIMEFNEGGTVSYSYTRWVRRGGNWACAEPGLSGLLRSMRMPDWITK